MPKPRHDDAPLAFDSFGSPENPGSWLALLNREQQLRRDGITEMRTHDTDAAPLTADDLPSLRSMGPDLAHCRAYRRAQALSDPRHPVAMRAKAEGISVEHMLQRLERDYQKLAERS